MMTEDVQIILASGSPRRKELLAQMGLAFETMPSDLEEKITGDTPSETVESLSYQKAADIASRIREGSKQQERKKRLVIGSDTIVVCGGKVMGKPRTEEEAFSMLSRIQGRVHEVYTGVTIAIIENDNISYEIFSKKASVTVHSMNEQEIRAYIAKGESMDKAGAYGIQGSFAMFVDEIQGEYSTVLGLPVAGLYQALKKIEESWK